MIRKVEIENYKTIKQLTLNLGRVNIFIGINGSGKSNIIEAIAFGAAAANRKLDNEFLSNRGIRVTDPKFMRSAFNKKNTKKDIKLSFRCDKGNEASFNLSNANESYSKWEEVTYVEVIGDDNKTKQRQIETTELEDAINIILKDSKKDDKSEHQLEKFLLSIKSNFRGSEVCKNFEEFLIYSPEISFLRNFEVEGQIEPLGKKGEGLFKLLKSFFQSKEDGKILDIINQMRLFDWFDTFDLTKDLFEGENRISITDKYIHSKLTKIDQRSLSEGFLYLLFYVTLIISDKTPNFFAIENLETALNPKLCAKVTKNIVDLSKKYNKQLLLTTHNPAILDGLNLEDEEQKLFVVYRNADGETTINNYLKPKPVEGESLTRLSESFLRGYVGGLPNNFNI